MSLWTRFGDVIGSHMYLVAPACILGGALFPDIFSATKPYVPIFFAIMTFQGSLNNSFSSVAAVFAHPRELLLILVCTIVVMPTCACAVARLIFTDQNIVIGATLEYCVPVAVVCFMWSDIYDGNRPLALAAVLTSTVLAPLTIPVMLKLLLGASVTVDTADMMLDMLQMIALPALAGMLVNELTHGWGHETLSPAISPVAKLMMMLNMLSNATGMSEYVRHLTPELVGAMGFILACSTSGFLLGFALSRLLGADRATSVTLTFGVALRNISAGAVIATQYFPGEVVFPVMIGTLFQNVLAGVFGPLVGRLLGGGPAKAAAGE